MSRADVRTRVRSFIDRGAVALYWLLEEFQAEEHYEVRAALTALRASGQAKVYENHSGTGLGILDVWGPGAKEDRRG